MSKRTTVAEVRSFARRLGLTCETNAPGDGIRRFEFTLDYQGGGWSSFCYGSREAWQFLRGYEKGFDAARRGGSCHAPE